MLAVLCFVSITDWKIQLKLKTDWKSRACVPLKLNENINFLPLEKSPSLWTDASHADNEQAHVMQARGVHAHGAHVQVMHA